MSAWRVAAAAIAGTSHLRSGLPCQDACRADLVTAVDGSAVLIASIADGAGSAGLSQHGARLAVDAFHDAFAPACREQPDLGFLEPGRARLFLGELREAIAAQAAASEARPEDFACTFLGAVVAAGAACFLQLGDGAIVVTEDGAPRCVHWPQHGEYANSTFFVTMAEAADMLAFERRETEVQQLVMFSDGMERLILDMAARCVHAPSIRPILEWLGTTPPGGADAASAVLARYLDSPSVNRRTDDDKSLVMATRIAAAPP